MGADTRIMLTVDSNIFTFDNEQDLQMFVEMLFAFADDRKLLYESILEAGNHLMLAYVTDQVTPGEGRSNAVKLYRGLKFVESKYSSKYDPDAEIRINAVVHGDKNI